MDGVFTFNNIVHRRSQQYIGLECPFKSHEYLCFYSQVINFLYYANDSHFVYEYQESPLFLSFVFMLTLGMYTWTGVCRVKLDVNLNENSWVLGTNACSGSAKVLSV